MLGLNTIISKKLTVTLFKKNLEQYFKKPVENFVLFYDHLSKDIKVIFEGKNYTIEDGKVLIKKAVEMFGKEIEKPDSRILFEKAFLNYKTIDKKATSNIDLFYQEEGKKKVKNITLF